MFYLTIVGFSMRARYYAPFKLMEAGVVMSGQAFNGYDKTSKKPKHNRIYGMDIYCTEFGVFHRSTVEEWNKPVQNWLKYCIHTRIDANPFVKMFITFFVSALWHGFYPMYFFGFAFYTISATNYQYIFKQFVNNKVIRNPIFYILLFLNLRISVCYFTSTFAILLTGRVMELTYGALWIPLTHFLFYIYVLIFDKKGSKPKPEWERYSKIKIYEILDAENILSGKA